MTEQRTPHTISLNGCDDVTTIVVELTDDELTLVRRLDKLFEAASDYGCQPIMKVDDPIDVSAFDVDPAV